jgi:hypothetical protein
MLDEYPKERMHKCTTTQISNIRKKVKIASPAIKVRTERK